MHVVRPVRPRKPRNFGYLSVKPNPSGLILNVKVEKKFNSYCQAQTHIKYTQKTRKLLQTCWHAVDKLRSHSLFKLTLLAQAWTARKKLDGTVRQGCFKLTILIRSWHNNHDSYSLIILSALSPSRCDGTVIQVVRTTCFVVADFSIKTFSSRPVRGTVFTEICGHIVSKYNITIIDTFASRRCANVSKYSNI